MVALARKTLIHEWRRFLPAAVAVACAGALLLIQAALVLGIFATASVYVSASSADLWLGYPGTQSVELGRQIPEIAELRARMDPEVTRVERFQWLDGDWRGPVDVGGVSVIVAGIDPQPQGLLFSKVLPATLRQRLLAPGAFIVDDADRDKLGLRDGGSGEINGCSVHLVGSVRGLRALGGVNIVTSQTTAQALGAPSADAHSTTYVLAQLRHPESAPQVKARLQAGEREGRYEVWTRDEFSRHSIIFWLFDTGAGLGFLFGALLVVSIGVVITSQTLMSAIAGSVPQYATLRALGVARADLGRIVLEQAAWLGGIGVLVGALASAAFTVLATSQSVPIAVNASMALACVVLVMAVALTSGVVAMRIVRHVDPALLLR